MVGPEPIVEHLRGLATELRLMAPVLTAFDQRREIIVEDGGRSVQVAERRIGQEKYLILVNLNSYAVRVRCKTRRPGLLRGVSVRFEPPAQYRIERATGFEDELPARWARVYRLDMAHSVK